MDKIISKEELFVRNACDMGIIHFSDHAYHKMRKLKITEAQVVHCIKHGFFVERQNGYAGEDPRMVFYNGHDNSFYVVVTVVEMDNLVITVCEVDFSKWKKVGDSIERIR